MFSMKLPENSLFGILLRARWWVSALVALGVLGVAQFVLPAGAAAFAALPFAVLACVVAWKEIWQPRGARLERALAELRAMPWETFGEALQAALRRDGFTVKRVAGAADFELEKAGQVSLLCARRWKATTTGVDPLKDLATAGERSGASECLYVTASALSDNARGFAAEKKVKLIEGGALLKLMRRRS